MVRTYNTSYWYSTFRFFKTAVQQASRGGAYPGTAGQRVALLVVFLFCSVCSTLDYNSNLHCSTVSQPATLTIFTNGPIKFNGTVRKKWLILKHNFINSIMLLIYCHTRKHYSPATLHLVTTTRLVPSPASFPDRRLPHHPNIDNVVRIVPGFDNHERPALALCVRCVPMALD